MDFGNSKYVMRNADELEALLIVLCHKSSPPRDVFALQPDMRPDLVFSTIRAILEVDHLRSFHVVMGHL